MHIQGAIRALVLPMAAKPQVACNQRHDGHQGTELLDLTIFVLKHIILARKEETGADYVDLQEVIMYSYAPLSTTH